MAGMPTKKGLANTTERPKALNKGPIKAPKIPGMVDQAKKAHKFMSHSGAKAGKGGKC
jgi:hypothetical protein